MVDVTWTQFLIALGSALAGIVVAVVAAHVVAWLLGDGVFALRRSARFVPAA